MSAFDDDAEGSSEREFEENLKRFENMLAGGENYYFDADDLEEIIDYYLQWINYDLAKKAIDYGLERFPYSTIIKIRYAQYLSSQHYTREALAILNEVEQIEQNNYELYMARGYIYSQMGLGEQAIQNFKNAIPLSEHKDEVYVALGIEFLNEEKADDALYYLKKAIKLNPKNPVSYNYRGVAKGESKQFVEALKDFDYSIKLKYDYAAAFVNRAAVKFASKDKHGACDDLNKADSLGDEMAIKLIETYCKH